MNSPLKVKIIKPAFTAIFTFSQEISLAALFLSLDVLSLMADII